jgi:cbb3-type cytochrome oxidase subunit 3
MGLLVTIFIIVILCHWIISAFKEENRSSFDQDEYGRLTWKDDH